MAELQSPRRRSPTAKTMVGLLLAVVMVGAFATAGSAAPRSGRLHVTKECSHLSDGYCTITGSNLNAIDAGMNVVYASTTPVGVTLDTDLVLDGPGNNDAYGHVTLDVTPGPHQFSGPLTFSGGTGRFRGFHATLWVTCAIPAGSPCAWDGRYSFIPPGHDK